MFCSQKQLTVSRMSFHLNYSSTNYFFACKMWFRNPASVNGSLPINPHNLHKNTEYGTGNQDYENYLPKETNY